MKKIVKVHITAKIVSRRKYCFNCNNKNAIFNKIAMRLRCNRIAYIYIICLDLYFTINVDKGVFALNINKSPCEEIVSRAATVAYVLLLVSLSV